MRYANTGHLRLSVEAKGCKIPDDERARMEETLTPLREAANGLPEPELLLKVIHHPRSQVYNVEARLRLPGRTLSTADGDAYLDSAFQRCVRKLVQRLDDYRVNPDREAVETARRREALATERVAPEGPDVGLVGRAVEAGDYKAFRTALAGYEDWIRLRVGRWLQRYPDAEKRVGDGILIGDLVEEVYLNAFEGYRRRRAEVPFQEWLEGLIDPSVRALVADPDGEHENASLARTLRETPM